MTIHSFSWHRRQVLALLKRRGSEGATTADISHPNIGGHEGPRRLRELRELGYEIIGEPMSNGYWRYHLRQPGEVVTEQADLFDSVVK